MIQYPDPRPTATSNVNQPQVKSIVVRNADGTTARDKAVIPANANILKIDVIVPTGTATATLSVGVKGVSATRFINATSVATAGQLAPTVSNIGNQGTTDQIITTTVGTTAVTSDIYVNIWYVR
jgi:hypothetical protein